MYLPIDGDDWEHLFEKWASDAEKYELKKAKFEEFKKRLKEAEAPFIEKQKKLFEQKRKRDKKAILTIEERDNIWRPYHKIYRKIVDEVFGK
ncbi:MAG: hypothetical protein WCE90_10295 [Candidatus Zixiibacteriota bacterium]